MFEDYSTLLERNTEELLLSWGNGSEELTHVTEYLYLFARALLEYCNEPVVREKLKYVVSIYALLDGMALESQWMQESKRESVRDSIKRELAIENGPPCFGNLSRNQPPREGWLCESCEYKVPCECML